MNTTHLNWQKDDYSNIQEPFEGDHWERKELAEHLTGYVGRLKVGATLALDAEWGAGKTWFVQHWKQHLINEGHQVAYLDAFANDYIDDPFLVIATEIANQLDKQEQGLGASVKNKAIAVWHAMLPSLPKMLFSAAMTLMGAGMLAQPVADMIKAAKEAGGDFGEAFAEDLNERIKEQLEEKVKNYEADKQTVEGFKNQLAKVACHLDKPLVFIIDELDRCKPEFSIRLIERIKHFFDTPNIVFVLSMHKKQLCESINSYYGFKSENQYLEKFIDFTILLTRSVDRDTQIEKSIHSNLSELGLIGQILQSDQLLKKSCKFLFENIQPQITPRQLRKILNKFSLLQFKSSATGTQNNLLLIFLFYKEAGNNDGIKDLSVISDLVDKIFYTFGLPDEDKQQPAETIDHTLRNKMASIGFSSNLKIATIKSYGTGSLNTEDYAPSSLTPNVDQPVIMHNFGKIWFDYIQRGIS